MDVRANYEQWLKDFASDADTVRELEAIRNDDREIEDRFYTELSFGTAGMRGVLGAGMNRMPPLQRFFCEGYGSGALRGGRARLPVRRAAAGSDPELCGPAPERDCRHCYHRKP